MRLARFDDNRLGLVEGYVLRDVTRVASRLPAQRWPIPPGDQLIAHLDELKDEFREAVEGMPRRSVTDVVLLSPVANPPRIIAAPVNYRDHAIEAKDPAIHHGVHLPEHDGYETPLDKFGLFLKSQTGVVGSGQGIEIHFADRRNDHEIELAVVIGRGGKNIRAEAAMQHVAGYCIGIDVTVRGPEDRSYRKSADSYTVLGPWLVTADEVPDPGNLELRLAVSGELRQRANTRDLLVPVPDLIARASRVYALHPGDVILTGTPAGVGLIKPGDTIRCYIEQVGEMDVSVR